MKRILSISSLCMCLFSPLSAQFDFNDLDSAAVSWVGEVYSNYRLGPVRQKLPAKIEGWNHLTVEKLLQPSVSNTFSIGKNNYLSFWSDILLELVKNEKIPAYSGADLQLFLTVQERRALIKTIDTIASFDHPGDTIIFEEKLKAEKLVGVRVRERLLYSYKHQKLKYQAIAFAPLVLVRNDEKEDFDIVPLCWYPVQNAREPAKLRLDTNIIYIAETRHLGSASKLENIKTLKGSFDLDRFLRQITENMKLSVYCAGEEFSLLTKEERLAATMSQIDSDPYIDPITFELSSPILNEPYSLLEEVKALQLVVRWFWDGKNCQLSSEFSAYAPLRLLEDESGNVRYYNPLFYVKAE